MCIFLLQNCALCDMGLVPSIYPFQIKVLPCPILWVWQQCIVGFVQQVYHYKSGTGRLYRLLPHTTTTSCSDLTKIVEWHDSSSTNNREVTYTFGFSLKSQRTDALPQDLMKSRSREFRVFTLKFDRHIGSSAVKFQSDTIIITSYLAASRLHETWRQDVLPLSE